MTIHIAMMATTARAAIYFIVNKRRSLCAVVTALTDERLVLPTAHATSFVVSAVGARAVVADRVAATAKALEVASSDLTVIDVSLPDLRSSTARRAAAAPLSASTRDIRVTRKKGIVFYP